MSIYYATDIHLTDKQPINRITPVADNCVNAFEELLSVAGNGTLILGGDLFESPCPSYELFNSVVKALKSARCKVFTVFGNHDILYGDFVAENNALRSLINLGLVNELSSTKTEVEGYDIYGISYRKSIYSDFTSVGLKIENPKKSIVVTHQFMSDMKLPYNHIRISDFKTDIPLVLCGHLHSPFNKTEGNTTYINTGCVCKLNRNEANFGTSCLKIDSNYQTKLISLKYETNVEFIQKEVNKQDFKQSITDAKIEKQDIDLFIKSSTAPEHIKELALSLIREYQNA